MPPQLTEEDVSSPSGKRIRTPRGFSEKMAKSTGISGIHYNMELGKDLVAALFQVAPAHLLRT